MKRDQGYQEALKRIKVAKQQKAIELDLKELGLTELPEEIGELSGLEILYLNNSENSATPNKLTQLPTSLFRLKNLKELRISYNLLQEIPAEIEQCLNLKHLYMYGNKFLNLDKSLEGVKHIELIELSVSKDQLLNHHTALKKFSRLGLSLEDMQADKIPGRLFELENIINLWLDHNKLTYLPAEIGRLKQLQKLVVRNNQLKELPQEFAQLTQLEELEFSQNKFEEFPSVVFKLTSLKELWAHSNQIKQLPDAIGRLKQLQQLYIHNNQLNELPQEIARLTYLEVLDFGENKFEEFPETVFKLSKLKALWAHSNQIKQIPNAIGGLKKLQQLYINNNQLNELPQEVAQLTHLEFLDFNENKFEEFPPVVFKLTSLKELGAHSNQIKQLPDAIGGLKQLRKLVVRNNLLKELPQEFAQLTQLEELEFSQNEFEEFPLVVFKLTSLKELWAHSNQIKQLPDAIGRLKQLQKLYIRDNQLNELPQEFAQLTQLEELEFSQNKFEEFPLVVFKLTSLKELWAHSNQIKQLPDAIGRLKQLQKLYIRDNQLNELPQEFAQLTQLEKLDLGENKFEEFPEIVFKLTKLKALWVHSNQIKQLPDAIERFKQLRKLYIFNNQLKELPQEIARLTHLEILDFAQNKFEEFPKIILQLSSLKEIHAEFNQIKIIPKEIISLVRLQRINLKQNSIENIPKEIVDSDAVEEIFNYFISLNETENEKYLYEAKLALVGRGFVGKTSLCRKLAIPDYVLEKKIPSTESIDIFTWELPIELEHSDHFRLNLWDFAGQEKYDATHQYFITERSIYLFVTEARQESNFLDFDYWLNVVTLLSNNSPVIVVQNKIDERHKQLPSLEYQARFPNILAFVDVSCATGKEHTIKALEDYIRQSIQKLPQVGDKLPKAWVDIRRELEELSRKKNTLSYEAYVRLCKKYGLNNKQAEFLSRYYHDLGIIVYYKDDILLKNLVIINSDWAVDGAYAVLNSCKVQENNGAFTNSDLAEIWKEPKYRNRQAELLALMRNYELCFELGQSKKYIIPNLLPANPVTYEVFNGEKSLRFIYQYAFMPAGIITRLIVRLHEYIEDETYWQHGVVLQHDHTRAEVLENRIDKRLSIQLEGSNCKGFLAIIRKEINEIHRDFHNLEFDEKIPCNCTECMKSKSPHFYKYKTLRRFEKKGRESVPCEKSAEDVSIQKLISDVFASSPSDSHTISTPISVYDEPKSDSLSVSSFSPNSKDTTKVFISYASQDIELQQKLNTALSALKRKRGLNSWTDQEILPGDEWNKEIMEKLAEADIVLLLISPDFIASEFCFVEELKIALNRHEEGSAKVIPVILRPCQWEDLPFSKLQSLPKGVKPVTKWENQDDAFLSIAEGIETVLNSK